MDEFLSSIEFFVFSGVGFFFYGFFIRGYVEVVVFRLVFVYRVVRAGIVVAFGYVGVRL